MPRPGAPQVFFFDLMRSKSHFLEMPRTHHEAWIHTEVNVDIKVMSIHILKGFSTGTIIKAPSRHTCCGESSSTKRALMTGEQQITMKDQLLRQFKKEIHQNINSAFSDVELSRLYLYPCFAYFLVSRHCRPLHHT